MAITFNPSNNVTSGIYPLPICPSDQLLFSFKNDGTSDGVFIGEPCFASTPYNQNIIGVYNLVTCDLATNDCSGLNYPEILSAGAFREEATITISASGGGGGSGSPIALTGAEFAGLSGVFSGGNMLVLLGGAVGLLAIVSFTKYVRQVIYDRAFEKEFKRRGGTDEELKNL